MNQRKILALLLALTLALCSTVFAEEATEAPAAEATEVPAEAAAGPTDEDPVIAEFGDVKIHLSEALPQYSSYYQMLASYGIDMTAYADVVKNQVISQLVQQAIEAHKTAELGYNEFTDDELAAATEDANARYQEMYEYYLSYFASNGVEDPESQTTAYLEQYGYTPETLLEKVKQGMATDKMADALTADLKPSDEDLKAYYDAAVAEDQEAYFENYTEYETAHLNGSDDVFAWNPEGYRRVRQVLIGFDDDAKSQYSTLTAELTKAKNGDEGARAEAEVQADIDALLAPLYEKAAEVRGKFDEGVSIDDLIAEYGSDPGMMTEPGQTEGYYVCANSQMWDQAFVKAAMSVDAVGQLGEPEAGAFGLYMVYYLADVTPGPVPYEEVREVLDAKCLDETQQKAYYSQLDAWLEELNVQYHMENFVASTDVPAATEEPASDEPAATEEPAAEDGDSGDN